MHVLAFVFGLLLALAPCLAQAEDKPAEAGPVLRIETGMHGAIINRLAVDEPGSRFVTVSDDKTTRIWSVSDGSQEHVWRAPIGPGDLGAVLAVAVHGDTLVTGGVNPNSGGTLYLYDLKAGHLRGAAPPDAFAISALAFSKDGHYLAVGHQGKGGLSLIEFPKGNYKAKDSSYPGTINWVAFAPDGTLATTSEDGEIRLLDADLKELARAKLPAQGDKPWGLSFSPDGTRLAVGDRNHADVFVLEAPSLKPVETLHGAANTGDDLAVVNWSGDGKLLAAGGGYRDAGNHRLVRLWHVARGKFSAPADVKAAADRVTDLAVLGSGDVLYSSAEPSFGVLRPGGAERLHHGPHQADFRDAGAAFKVSADGGVVEFPSRQGGKQTFRFDLVGSMLSGGASTQADLRGPMQQDPMLQPANWQNSTSPTVAGNRVDLEPNEHVRAMAVWSAPKARSIHVVSSAGRVVLGTDFYLRAVGVGADKGWRTVIPAPAFAVNATADGRYVMAGLGDGTIRWYRAADGALMLSLFVDPEDGRWVNWMPEGYFAHSESPGKPGGETLVGWQIDHGPGKPSDFVEVGQIFDKLYRRDLILARFRGGEVEQAYLQDQMTRSGGYQPVIETGLAPSIRLLGFCIAQGPDPSCLGAAGNSAAEDARKKVEISGTGDTLAARYAIADQGGGLGKVLIRRDGVALEGTRKTESDDGKKRVETVLLPLKPGSDTLDFRTVSGNGAIELAPEDAIVLTANVTAPEAAAAQTQTRAAVPTSEGTTAPTQEAAGTATPSAEPAAQEVGKTLYAVVVGISKYDVPDFRLENADNDARAVVDLLKKPAPPVYVRKPIIRSLLNEKATVPNIKTALNKVAEASKPEDIVVIYFSGHGKDVDGKYYFAPVDFATRSPEVVEDARHADAAQQEKDVDDLFRREGLSADELVPIFSRVQGDVLIVLDTCFSGDLARSDGATLEAHNNTAAQHLEHDTGRFLIAGARAEAADSNADAPDHGIFTYWLLKGLEGEADSAHEGKVSVVELLKYTKRTVILKSGSKQRPNYLLSGNEDFELRGLTP